jgi:hypothetical protein
MTLHTHPLMALAAVALFISGVAFVVGNLVLKERLATSGVELSFFRASMPGYVEGQYLQAPDEIRRKLAHTYAFFRWARRSFVGSIVLLPICGLASVLL